MLAHIPNMIENANRNHFCVVMLHSPFAPKTAPPSATVPKAIPSLVNFITILICWGTGDFSDKLSSIPCPCGTFTPVPRRIIPCWQIGGLMVD